MNIDLEKRDRICFFGDSITAHGWWISEITEYFLNNYPDLKIQFFNCGIPGSKGFEANLKNRMYCDLFNYFPRYVVIMFGMNDVFPHLYYPGCGETDKIKKREEKLAEYKGTLKRIVDLCIDEGTVPILCTPTPYDEYNSLSGNNWQADVALKYCAEVTKEVAEEYNLLLADFRGIIMQHIKEKPIMEDRIHPNKYGHHLMAECFLTAIGAKENVETAFPVKISKLNELRYNTEQKIRTIMFVERDIFGWQYEETKEICERKKIVAQRMSEMEKMDELAVLFDDYLKCADFRDELLGKLIRINSQLYQK